MRVALGAVTLSKDRDRLGFSRVFRASPGTILREAY